MAQSKDDNPKPKSDERNIVDAAASSGADLEDQLALIWEENKKFIIYCVAGIFVVFGIYHFSKFMVPQAEASLKEGLSVERSILMLSMSALIRPAPCV